MATEISNQPDLQQDEDAFSLRQKQSDQSDTTPNALGWGQVDKARLFGEVDG